MESHTKQQKPTITSRKKGLGEWKGTKPSELWNTGQFTGTIEIYEISYILLYE
jgi:hypothetical protein